MDSMSMDNKGSTCHNKDNTFYNKNNKDSSHNHNNMVFCNSRGSTFESPD